MIATKIKPPIRVPATHVAMNKLRLVLRNIMPFCNLIGSARIPAETKGQPKKVNVSNQTPFSEGGAVGTAALLLCLPRYPIVTQGISMSFSY